MQYDPSILRKLIRKQVKTEQDKIQFELTYNCKLKKHTSGYGTYYVLDRNTRTIASHRKGTIPFNISLDKPNFDYLMEKFGNNKVKTCIFIRSQIDDLIESMRRADAIQSIFDLKNPKQLVEKEKSKPKVKDPSIKRKRGRPRKYLEIEEKMRNLANEVNIPLSHLDLLFWSKETGEIFK